MAGCSGALFQKAKTAIDRSQVKQEPLSRTGNNPYTVFGVTYVPLKSAVGYREKGVASWYGKKFHGRRTSSGETYNMYAMTAAHKTLPLPTYVEVTNLNNNRKIIVKVNDRGPFIDNRIIDLSFSAAQELDLVKSGTGPVLVESITPWSKESKSTKPASQKFFVSTGVFRNRDNAQNLTSRLNDSGFKKAHIRTKNVSGTEMHQVLVGPFKSDSKARKTVTKLLDHLTEPPVVISE